MTVLIEVPTLRSRPFTARVRTTGPAPKRRRRLRREIRLGGLLALVALPLAALGVRLLGPGDDAPPPVVRLSAAIEPVVLRGPTDDDPDLAPPPVLVLAPDHVMAEPPAYGGGGRRDGN
jgi:hypothetical protein